MLDIHALMSGLAIRRPLFHSEADFQHELAWQIHLMESEQQVRLEMDAFPRPSQGRPTRLDIWLPREGVAVELKYLTRKLEYEDPHTAELFVLKNDALDISRYGALTDIQRLERLRAERSDFQFGYVIALTNDHLYWEPPRRDSNNDYEFRIEEGRTLKDRMVWKEGAKPGKGREAPIVLEGSYSLHWRDYGRRLRDGSGGSLRYLAISVGL